MKKRILCNRIVEYLQSREDKQGDLDEILISIYDNELKQLSLDIHDCINELKSEGVLIECGNSGQQRFKLCRENEGLTSYNYEENNY